eukprot:TRINITY_DN1956_c0_g1_i5.p1 TRINITY_DN1956_c0_g1~~TRINITY_DN1956_c0_g1_i5.p1  ORF type:complete len:228 (+),score=95.72 TRINITY_DN1956_c0_g1_i5:166-849(+)
MFDEKKSIEYLKQLLKAVEHLKLNRISHRDIKPDNILLRGAQSLHLMLADFDCCLDFVKMSEDQKNKDEYVGDFKIRLRNIDYYGVGGAINYLSPEVRTQLRKLIDCPSMFDSHFIVEYDSNGNELEESQETIVDYCLNDEYAIGLVMLDMLLDMNEFDQLIKEQIDYFDKYPIERAQKLFEFANEQLNQKQYNLHLISIILQLIQPNPNERMNVTQAIEFIELIEF